jgi:hypothetical protein
VLPPSFKEAGLEEASTRRHIPEDRAQIIFDITGNLLSAFARISV